MSAFGEIVEPGSRAAWEDWDDVNAERNLTKLQWQQDLEAPKQIESLFIFEGKYLSDCIKLETQSKLELINSIPKVNLHLLKTKGSNKYICTITNYNLVLSSEIVELLKPYLLASKDVIAIQTKSSQEYHTSEPSATECIIRAVSNTKALSTLFSDINFPKLEQPNIISGVSAGVINLREHLDMSGVAVVCYIQYPDEYQIEEVEKLLAALNVSQQSKSRPSSVLNSNLYT